MIGIATWFFLRTFDKKISYMMFFVLWILMASLYKEAFILLIPTYIFAYLTDWQIDITLKDWLYNLKRNIIRYKWNIFALAIIF